MVTGRRLHEKLSSPDRYGRTRMTPEQARQKHEARQNMADLNRDKSVMERKQKVNATYTLGIISHQYYNECIG
jgi:hypothetical protein